MANIGVMSKGLSLPVVTVHASNLPDAWEAAITTTWREGAQIKTQYDPPDVPPSRDVILVLTVDDAFAEPRYHRAFPGGLFELEVYRREVVEGLHDHWIDPAGGKWEYTYHQRFAAFDVPGLDAPVNQLGYMLEALAKQTYTRQVQAITWQPWQDAGIKDPPCLQRIWCRVFDDALVMHIYIRSNDAFKAAFMNMYAFTDLQRALADALSLMLGRRIRPGQYSHVADSFHIYGKDFVEFQGFLGTLEKRAWEDRTWHTWLVAREIAEAAVSIPQSLRHEMKTGQKGIYDCGCCCEGE